MYQQQSNSLEELFLTMKYGQKIISQVLCDTYPDGHISHRADGDYVKQNGEWNKLSENPYFDNREYPPGSMFISSKNMPIKSRRGDGWYIESGEHISDLQVIARSHGIKNIEYYKRKIGGNTRTEDWSKCMGLTFITNGSERRFVEIHWYYVKNLGKIWFKEKID